RRPRDGEVPGISGGVEHGAPHAPIARMRLFVAVELDENARWAIGAEQKRLMSTRAGSSKSLRWVRPEQMHLTLVFVGNVDDAVGASIVDAMSGEVAAEPFTLAFGRLGIFPPRGDPSVLWLGVTDGVREAVALQRAVADRLEPAGVARET